MWTKRVQRMIEKNRNEVLGIGLRRYPAFILSNRPDEPVGIPAFAFHDITAESLEPMLQFLVDNRYATLTGDEYTERQLRSERGQEREVLLTFDDGCKSLYTVVYPALKRFGLKALAYIVPGMTPQDNDSDNSKAWGSLLCNWKEIRMMHESGVLDIQSHSMYHHSIPISPRVVDFIRPGMTPSFLASDLAPLNQQDGGSKSPGVLSYGMPIYDWGPRFGKARAFRENSSGSLACVEYVNRHGGADFFRTPEWRQRLNTVLVAEVRRENSSQGGFETESEQRRAILSDFVDAKRAIERQLPGKQVRHFCYPWFQGSALAEELSAAAGYVSTAWGSLLPKLVCAEQTPIRLARLSPSYLWRLPGKGRKPIGEVLRERWSQIG